MKKTFFKSMIVLVALSSLFSCSKKETPAPVISTEQTDNAVDRYYPLGVGNKWNYLTPNYNYEISITGKSKVGSTEYYNVYNSYTKQTGNIRYQDNKYYQSAVLNNGQTLELMFLDEKAKTGDEWKMGEYTQTTNGLILTTKYNCKVVSRPSVYTVNDSIYKDVIIVETTTSAQYDFTEQMKNLYGSEYLTILEFYNSQSTALVKQTQYYARGIGFVYQTSDYISGLNVELKSYDIVNR